VSASAGARLFAACTALVIFLALLAPNAQGQADVSRGKIENLSEEIAEIDAWIEDAKGDRSDLEQALARSENKISALKKERRDLQQQAAAQQKNINGLRQKEQQLNEKLAGQREALGAQIRAAWMQGDAPALQVLLNESDPQKVARTMTYHEYLSRDALERLNAFKNTLQTLRETQAQAASARQQLQDTEATLTRRQANLEAQTRSREQTLARLASSISDKQSERKKLVTDRERLEQLLQEVEASLADMPTPDESQPFETQHGKLPWPSRGKVITGYGESLHGGRLRHNGLLLSAAREAEIEAVHHGRVVFANWLRGFGLMVIVDHGGGYMSLYGRNSSLLKSPGDWVRTGEPIAIAGDSGGNFGYTLYFEIRRKGKPQNPAPWLAPRS
jgi:septal ring factor EnvC (AmiA/AmiB activator)